MEKTKLTKFWGSISTSILLGSLLPMNFAIAQTDEIELNQSCVVNVLNRTIRVSADGGWSLPNIPSFMGRVRARATCVQNGQTISGESAFFNVQRNGITSVGEVVFTDPDPVPESLAFNLESLSFNGEGDTEQIAITATFQDTSSEDFTHSSGMNYFSSNSNIAAIDETGLITATSPGNALIIARIEGAIALLPVSVGSAVDTDQDGIPDDFELANGLDPNDPFDAFEDLDADGLSNLDEFNLGTAIDNPDTDGDGIEDGEEVELGNDGFITNPLLADSDGDGVPDLAEILAGTDPNDAGSVDISAAMVDMVVSPSTARMVINTIDSDNTLGLQVTATLLDGTELDITSRSFGTNYSSSNLTRVNFGAEDGLLYATQNGSVNITVSNGSFSQLIPVLVETYSPQVKDFVTLPARPLGLAEQDGYIYAAVETAGLSIVNASNPNNLSLVRTIDTPGSGQDVLVNEEVLYMADGGRGIRIYDISDPITPVLLSTLDTTSARDLWLVGDRLYLADGNGGLRIIDVSDASNPLIIATLNTGFTKGVAGDESIAVVVVSNAIVVVDVSDIGQITEVSRTPVSSARDLSYKAPYAHIAAYTSGHRIFDLTLPESPNLVSTISNFYPLDVELESELAFFAEIFFRNAIPYVDIRDESVATFKGVIDLDAQGFDEYNGLSIDLTGDHIYLGADRYSEYRLYSVQHRDFSSDDTMAPRASITRPNIGDRYYRGQSLLIEASATDDIRVKSVEFFVNDQSIGIDTKAPFLRTYQGSLEDSGELLIRAVATDYVGHTGQSAELAFEIFDDQPSSITFTNLTEGQNFQLGERISIVLDATDQELVDYVEFYYDGEFFGVDSFFDLQPYEISRRVSLEEAPRNNVPIRAVVKDRKGFETEATVNINIVENTPSTIVITKPTEGQSTTPGGLFEIAGTATESGDTYVRSLIAIINEEEIRLQVNNITNQFSKTLFFPEIEPGEVVEVKVEAYDNLGAKSVESVSVNVVSDQPPAIAIVSPTIVDRLTEQNPQSIVVNASDDIAVNMVELYVDGFLVGVDFSAPFSFTYTPSTAQAVAGSIGMFARAYDRKFPNLNPYYNGSRQYPFNKQFTDSETRVFDVDLDQVPTVYISEPTQGAILLTDHRINVTAIAADDVAVDRVEVYRNGLYAGRLSEPDVFPADPNNTMYLGSIFISEVGQVELTAKVIDNIGQESFSTPVVLQVEANAPPVVILDSPNDGDVYVENSMLTLQATAYDDLIVTQVEFSVNGEVIAIDRSLPYETLYKVPSYDDVQTLEILARATDNSSQTGDSLPITVYIDPDPLTSAIGRIVDDQSQPLAQANVSLNKSGGDQIQSDTGGSFRFDDVPTSQGDLQASASAVVDSQLLVGSTDLVRPQPGDITDMGTITLREYAGEIQKVLARNVSAQDLDMVVDDAGRIHMIWIDLSEDDGSTKLIYQLNDSSGKVLVGPSQLTAELDFVEHAYIALSESGTPWIAWSHQASEINLLELNLDSENISDSSGDLVVSQNRIETDLLAEEVYLHGLVSNSEGIHVVWSEVTHPNENIVYQKFDSTYGTPKDDKIIIETVDLPESYIDDFTVVNSGSGELMLLWIEIHFFDEELKFYGAGVDSELNASSTLTAELFSQPIGDFDSYTYIRTDVNENGDVSVVLDLYQNGDSPSPEFGLVETQLQYFQLTSDANLNVIKVQEKALDSDVIRGEESAEFDMEMKIDSDGDIYLVYPQLSGSIDFSSTFATRIVVQKYDRITGNRGFEKPFELGFIRYVDGLSGISPASLELSSIPGSDYLLSVWSNEDQLNANATLLPLKSGILSGTVSITESLQTQITLAELNEAQVVVRIGENAWATIVEPDGSFNFNGIPFSELSTALVTAVVAADSGIRIFTTQTSAVLLNKQTVDIGNLDIELVENVEFIDLLGDRIFDSTLGDNNISIRLPEVYHHNINLDGIWSYSRETTVTPYGLEFPTTCDNFYSNPSAMTHRLLPMSNDRIHMDDVGAVYFHKFNDNLVLLTWNNVKTYIDQPDGGRRQGSELGKTYQILLTLDGLEESGNNFPRRPQKVEFRYGSITLDSEDIYRTAVEHGTYFYRPGIGHDSVALFDNLAVDFSELPAYQLIGSNEGLREDVSDDTINSIEEVFDINSIDLSGLSLGFEMEFRFCIEFLEGS